MSAHTAVISGDVINQATISSNQVGVTISPGAVITGAFVNTSNALIRGHDTGPGIRAAAGILDLAAGAPRIENHGQIVGFASATGAATDIALAAGVVQIGLSGSSVSDSVANDGSITGQAIATAAGGNAFALAAAGGVIQIDLAASSATAIVDNDGVINASATATAIAPAAGTAVAVAIGVGQVVAAGSVATASVDNSGQINANANALSTFATTGLAVAVAQGVGQLALAGSTANASVANRWHHQRKRQC